MNDQKIFRVTQTSVSGGMLVKRRLCDVTAFSRRLNEPAYLVRTLAPESILRGEFWPGLFLSEPFSKVDDSIVSECVALLEMSQGKHFLFKERENLSIEIGENFHMACFPASVETQDALRMDTVWIFEIIAHLIPGLNASECLSLMREGRVADGLKTLEEPVLECVDNHAVWNSLRIVLKRLGYNSPLLGSALSGVSDTCFAHQYDIPRVVISKVDDRRPGRRKHKDWVSASITPPGEMEPTEVSTFNIHDSTLSNLIGCEFAREVRFKFLNGSASRTSVSWIEEDLLGHD